MLATINSHYDYHLGRTTDFNLKSAIADAGGNRAHYNAFNLLIDWPIQAVSKETGDVEIFPDTNAGCALLFLFPPSIQVMLCSLFKSKDDDMRFILTSSGKYEAPLASRKASDILKIHSAITGVPFNPYILRAVDESNYKDIPFLLGKSDTPFISKEDLSLYDGIDRIMSSNNHNPVGLDKFSELVVNNDRVSSSAILARGLGYTEQSTQEIAGVIEKWILSI